MLQSATTSANFSKIESSQSQTHHYLTFPTPPPKSRGRPPISPTRSFTRDSFSGSNFVEEWDCSTWNSSIPKGQLILLAAISLVEQTALNSMSPYLPEMVKTFPGVKSQDKGIAVGTLGSVFAFAQFSTNFFWGWLSDRIGRKPVMMIGTISTAACFVAFGFCRNLWQAIVIQVLMGLVNGNQGIISSCLGEMTNKSNQSRVFVYLPVVFGVGAITGPAIGGLMIFQKNPFNKEQKNPYPFIVPNILSAIILTITFVLMAYFLEETLEKSDKSSSMRKTMAVSFRQQRQLFNKFYTSFRYRFSSRSELFDDFDEENCDSMDRSETRSLLSESVIHNIHENEDNTKSQAGQVIFCRDTLILLGTYLVFQLSNVSFNSLYPIFLSEKEPIGRNLSVESIGISLSLSGVIAIIFQGIFLEKLKQKIGNKATYRAVLFLFFISMIAMPWVNYSRSPPPFGLGDGQFWLWIELGFLLFLKTIASVGGFTSALLLITNTAPNHSVLGTLNGLAQTLSAAGRAIGPILSGFLFSTAATRIHSRGEVLPWTVFGVIAFLSFLASFGIKSSNLESELYDEQNSQNEDEQFY
ncbi:putative membrane protein [Erysiphe neolycopersici]|uniref:Putative membrane protein n=1 Tax=Erysiphe neolycopersici TaxID=212602 RepID=A0A420HDT9_9PEZI|nr:putative membrane protein [Erysiphe neolycopersici]